MSNPESPGAEQHAEWKASPEPLQTEVTVDELVSNVSGGWDETMALQGVTKESAQKLLQEAYQAFDAAYEKRNTEDNASQLETLEKVIDFLRKKKSEPDKETLPPQSNVIDRSQEFTQRTQMNEALKSARQLAFEMWGDYTALAQGNKILPLVKNALSEIRFKMQEIQSGRAMNSDIAETLAVLRSGLRNRQKEKQARNPQPDVELDAALAEVENFIAEIKPPEVPQAQNLEVQKTKSALG